MNQTCGGRKMPLDKLKKKGIKRRKHYDGDLKERAASNFS
jgi:hypothetical protein